MTANSHLQSGIDRRRHAGRHANILYPRDAEVRKNNALPEHGKVGIHATLARPW